ncbi:MAG: hypothetical protein ACKOYN_04495 [Planctomycetota bacterium]
MAKKATRSKSTAKPARRTRKSAGKTQVKVKATAARGKSVKSVKSKLKPKSKSKSKSRSTVPAKDASPSGRIASITPSRDGLAWTLRFAKGPALAVSSAAAQACRVKVGAAWSTALAARVEQAALDQLAFTHAMEALATKGAIRRAELERLIGGDARAKRTVAALVRNGWVR